jgi:hypothetical protein
MSDKHQTNIFPIPQYLLRCSVLGLSAEFMGDKARNCTFGVGNYDLFANT